MLKGKWEHGRLTDDQYFDATRFLVINAWGGKPKIDDIGLFNPAGAHAVQALAKRHSLDLSDSANNLRRSYEARTPTCACTTQEISRNVYDGVNNHNDALKSTPPDDSSPRVPSYNDYDRERRALSKPASQ